MFFKTNEFFCQEDFQEKNLLSKKIFFSRKVCFFLGQKAGSRKMIIFTRTKTTLTNKNVFPPAKAVFRKTEFFSIQGNRNF